MAPGTAFSELLGANIIQTQISTKAYSQTFPKSPSLASSKTRLWAYVKDSCKEIAHGPTIVWSQRALITKDTGRWRENVDPWRGLQETKVDYFEGMEDADKLTISS